AGCGDCADDDPAADEPVGSRTGVASWAAGVAAAPCAAPLVLPAQPARAAQPTSSVSATAVRSGLLLRTPVSRHFTRHELRGNPPSWPPPSSESDPGTPPGPPPRGSAGAGVGAFGGSDIELLHAEHGRRGTRRLLLVGVVDHVEEHGRHDLPGQAVLVGEPAAGDPLAAFGQPVPGVVDLGLVGAARS